jgi:hypothetical protein
MKVRGLVLRIGLTLALAFVVSGVVSVAPHQQAVAGCDSCR